VISWRNGKPPRALSEDEAVVKGSTFTDQAGPAQAQRLAIRPLPIASIRTDGGTQPRAKLDDNTLIDFMDDMRAGAKFPPVIVFHDGENYWLADGFHRREAHHRLGPTEIEADIRKGTRRDAILFSVGANADHGLRRTHKDKRVAVRRLLDDPEWSQWSDSEIARRCIVSRDLVAEVRLALTSGTAGECRYRTKHGTVSTMKTGKLGRKPSAKTKQKALAAAARPVATRTLVADEPLGHAQEVERVIDAIRTIAALQTMDDAEVANVVAFVKRHSLEDDIDIAANEIAKLRQRFDFAATKGRA
jgi:ParB-like chromosome segregation protein Spo0J